MKKLLTAGACAAAIVWGGNASATLYDLTDEVIFDGGGIVSDSDATLDSYGWGAVDLISGFGDHVVWTHNYTFDPAWDNLIDADLTLTFADDKHDCWFKWEVGVTLAEGGLFDWNEIDNGSYSYDVNLTSVGDGSFQVGVVGILGDFYLTSSVLDIKYETYDDPVAPVPEPATMVLFGVGLGITGFTSIRRKLIKK